MALKLLLLLPLLAPVALVTAQQGDDLAVVRQRIIASQFPSNASSAVPAVKTWMEKLKPDGSWPDIDYTNADRADWTAAEHTDRVLKMSVAWANPACPLHADATLLAKTLSAITYWLDKDYQNPNWWWNQIGIPLDIGPSCLMLQSNFKSNQTAGCTRILDRCNYTGWTGENLVWEGEGMLFDALLHEDASKAQAIFQHIFSSIVVTDGEADGIKIDGSFFQHGSQLMNGAYGGAFAASMLEIVPWTAGTRFQPSEETLTVLSNYLLRGTQPVVLYPTGQWDISVVGRGITRGGCCNDDLSASLIASLPGPNRTALAAFANRVANPLTAPPFVGPVHYWKADYVGHRQATWVASVKMYSKRTYNAECVNDEGKKSLHLSDGVVWIYFQGNEWHNVAPALNWDQLPGSTVEQGLVPLQCSTTKLLGKTAFVGGVVDAADPSLYVSLAADDFEAALSGTLKGKKLYAWFGGISVWLGAGLRSTAPSKPAVITTAVQQPAAASLAYADTTTSPLGDGQHTLPLDSASHWLHHGGIGYIFGKAPSGSASTLDVYVGNQTGKWEDIGAGHGTVTTKFVRAGVDHTAASRSAEGATYEILVVPDVSLATFAANVAAYTGSVEIVANNDNQQAVLYKGSTFAAAFYTAGSLKTAGQPWSVTVDQPCAIILSAVSATETRVVVSDPSQNGQVNQVKVTVQTPLAVQPVTSTIALPQGEMRGSSVVVILK
eukprot:TRINITY_DN11776_c0_g1_i2.p1 TRINITY_DN11776_c0_g1~~TRINITY_DN11776_c0_g1_i2.p1  ORF type:complete len:721 (+),score=146.32 TRINITY_DN11776_c0_g1_i2:53-2215(+)